MITKMAVFSDIHANLPALEVVLADIDRRLADGTLGGVYCLGDLGGYAGEPNQVQELIMRRGHPTVLGNYDEGVGFERDDCGCHYVKPLDIQMSSISFGWTREHTSPANKAAATSLARCSADRSEPPHTT
jgi:hypothetical protein